MLRYAFAGSLPLTSPLPSSPHTLMLTHLAGITDIGTCQNALRIAASDEGAAAAAAAAALPTARAGPPAWRRRLDPRTGPGASAPGGAGSGSYDEGAAAAAVAGPPGWRRRSEPGPGPAQQQGKPLCFYFPAPRCGGSQLPLLVAPAPGPSPQRHRFPLLPAPPPGIGGGAGVGGSGKRGRSSIPVSYIFESD